MKDAAALRVSVTRDTYFGRHEASTKVADALSVIDEEPDPAEKFPAGKVRQPRFAAPQTDRKPRRP
jgi:hypothetical protein